MVDLVRVAANSEENWGKLVKTWATGKSYFPTVSVDKLPVPRTIADLKAQCALPGVNVDITIPASFTGLTVIQHSPETIALRLPAKKMVEDAEAQFAQPNSTYTLPNFYKQYCGPLQPLPNAEAKKLFQALRIGDYSISTCD